VKQGCAQSYFRVKIKIVGLENGKIKIMVLRYSFQFPVFCRLFSFEVVVYSGLSVLKILEYPAAK
jgi:hypothetical protein